MQAYKELIVFVLCFSIADCENQHIDFAKMPRIIWFQALQYNKFAGF